ncbi:MAG: DUF1156 domain-containing protein [Chloroflexota bacterium]
MPTSTNVEGALTRKLIEVALPIEAINRAAGSEKGAKGHPNTLHQWWARRPLASCRAVIFASLVDDPGNYLPEDAAERERERLFRLIERLAEWRGGTDSHVLGEARWEIARSAARGAGLTRPQTDADVARLLATVAPPVYDPFSGSGSIPIEAQRLGLRSRASDLNPVAVLMTRAVIELPAQYGDHVPVNPRDRARALSDAGWRRPSGLIADIRYYAEWIGAEAERQLSGLYPSETDGVETVAWLWARTVTCPNPACGAQMPLIRSLWLCSKPKRAAWLEPRVEAASRRLSGPASIDAVDGEEKRRDAASTVRFDVRTGRGEPGRGTVTASGAWCLACGPDHPVKLSYVRAEGQAGRIGHTLLAVATRGNDGLSYRAATDADRAAARVSAPDDLPELEIPRKALGFRVRGYGATKFQDLFTPRQLTVLTTLSDLVGEVRARIEVDAAGSVPDAAAYARAVCIYLAFAVSRAADRWSTLTRWLPASEGMAGTFGRPTLSMVWDYCEPNPFGESTGSWLRLVDLVTNSIQAVPAAAAPGQVEQRDAASSAGWDVPVMVCTDPPYYANIGYAHLSDYFYAWLRPMLRQLMPELFGTLETPKSAELVAEPARFDDDWERAAAFFEEGFFRVFSAARQYADPAYPTTIFYAYKQTEQGRGSDGDVVSASTGWETALSGLIRAGFQIVGTWPLATEMAGRLRDIGSNALATSIVLVCRPRPVDAVVASRGEFIQAMRRELPSAIRLLQSGNIAPIDLIQAAIGPGMAIYSRYAAIIDSQGAPVNVRTALQLINQTLSELLSGGADEFDSSTNWALAWFDLYGFGDGPFGQANTLCVAHATAMNVLEDHDVTVARAGNVRLINVDERARDEHRGTRSGEPLWVSLHRLIGVLQRDGEAGAAKLVAAHGDMADTLRDLAYRLYSVCDRQQRSAEALTYNAVIMSWPEIVRLAQASQSETPQQPQLI